MSVTSPRPATLADASALADLATQLGYPSSAGEMERRLAAALPGADEAVLVAEENGVVIGWIHVLSTRSLVAGPEAEIHGLVVDAGRRGRGVGARLLEAAERWASEKGLGSVRVRTNVVREDAYRFYVRAGYRVSKRQAVFTKPLPS